MTKLLRRPRPLHTGVLLTGWKKVSLRKSWRFEDDWAVPETIHLATAYTHGLPLGEAARDLGLSRALQGIGITETIEDLQAFFVAAGIPADTNAQQRLTEGWVAATEAVQPISCTDPLTGLPTYEHLRRVLHDLYTSPGFNPDAFVIGRINLAPLPQGATLRWTILAELGQCCQEAFDNTGATLAYQRNTITVLMPRTNGNYARMISCHAALTRISYFPWDPAEITYERLPSEPTGLLSVLANSPHY
ncbi:hypothetical protein J2Y41_003926 [Arthrobacter sp. 1088]|uniref:hypothetical protein n=1 Tax=Arthrobacter sp. 1088 TaxID=2817768 RepID=UPI002854F6BA|nr:hypothetical protein [Arthrobacter sp. 1088]MDR6688340.1 hypothetical protein [Arthrobacter sp. 1088]